MTENIDKLVSFPVNAQRNTLFGALSSILLYRESYTDDTPMYCGKYQRECVRCGGCGKEPFVYKHHLRLYQYLLTVTGCAFFWIDKEIGDTFDKQYVPGEFSETARDRLSLALYAVGYRYETINKSAGESVLFDKIKQSVAEKHPVLIKLGKGDVWAVITGYDNKKQLPYLMKFRHAPQLNKDWYDKLANIVFITDKYDSTFSLSEAFDRMIRSLNADGGKKVEQRIYRLLETEQDGKKLGLWLNKIIGLTVESRWHASECYRNTLITMFDDNNYKQLLLQASDLHLRFHDCAWQVWDILGVSPQTGYCLPHNINELLSKPSARDDLKHLFGELFTLDREVSSILQECLSLLP